MMKSIFCSLAMFVLSGQLVAQNTVDFTEFKQRVLDNSNQLKGSIAERKALLEAMKLARTSFFPAIDATGNYQYSLQSASLSLGEVNVPLKRNSYDIEVGIVQPLYAGGSIRHQYAVSRIQADMGEARVELTTDNVLHEAEVGYWGTVAQKAMYDTMCRYVGIISQLLDVLQQRYEDGYISRTDLVQMETRMKEAELQQSASFQSYQLALQNLNVMMGVPPRTSLEVSDSIFKPQPMPSYVPLEEVLAVRPDYLLSLLEVESQRHQVGLAVSSYNPSLSIGFKEGWGTSSFNVSGKAGFGGTLFATLRVPVFHWGARFKAKAAQKALLLGKEFALADTFDRVSQELARAWSNLQENERQLALAEENKRLAEVNLDLNTYSYNQGSLTILDVLSAQLTWIQAYTNLIQKHYEQKVFMADYRKVAGLRYQPSDF